MSADRNEVFPAPGGPLTMTDAEDCMAIERKLAALSLREPRSTSESRVSRRSAYRRIVADKRSATGGMTAVSRADPSRTRAWETGLDASNRRSVPAISRSMTCLFSCSELGVSRPRNRPPASRYVT
jgi:hypothetical protein